jgi:hypothetical protein
LKTLSISASVRVVESWKIIAAKSPVYPPADPVAPFSTAALDTSAIIPYLLKEAE